MDIKTCPTGRLVVHDRVEKVNQVKPIELVEKYAIKASFPV
jgi:hypothetical protein